MKSRTLHQRLYSAKQSIIRGWKLCLAGELPIESQRDRIKHFLWLKDHKKN
jgi:hypothetical protein